MPSPATASTEEAYLSDDANSTREHARTLVRMADMVTRSTEKVEQKVGMDNYEESASHLLDGSDALNLDLEGAAGDGDANDGINEGSGNDGDVPASAGGGGGGDGDGDDASPAPRRQSKNSGKRGSNSSSTKEEENKEDSTSVPSPSSVEASTLSPDDLNGDDTDVSLRDQLTQTRRALLQVRENAKLKYRKLQLEHKTVKKELKKAKDVIEKQTVEYKKLKVKLEGTKKERDDVREELSRELSGRGSLASGISKENGRMIRRLREIRSERDNLVQERDELKQALERCTCEAGEDHEFTLASSLAHETVPMNQASAFAPRNFVSESRRNIFESAMSIRSNLSDEMEHEIEATKEDIARRRNGTSGSSVSFREPARRDQRSYLRPGEEKMAVDYDYDDDDDKSTISFISMSVRSLPATTKKAIGNVWSSTSMRLNNEIDLEHSGPGDGLTVEFKNKRRSRGERSYHRNGKGHEDEAVGENIAPRGEPRSTVASSANSGKGFWASTSQRFLMGMAQEVDD